MFIRFFVKLVPILIANYVYCAGTDSLAIYLDLGLLHEKQGNLTVSELNYKKAAGFATSNLAKADIYNNLGIVLRKQGKYDLALYSYQKAEEIGQDTSNLVKVYSNIGTIYQIKGDYKKALLYNNKALNLVFSKKWKASILNNIANIFYLIKDFEKALTYYKESLELKKEFDPLNISYSYLNIALCYQALKKGDKAGQYFNKAIREIINIYGNNHYLLIKAYANYGNFLMDTQSEKAFNLLFKANRLALQNYGGKHPETAKTWMYLGSYYLAKKEYKKVLEHYQQAIIANSKGFDDMDIYQNPALKNAISELQQLEILHNKAAAFQKYSAAPENQERGLKTSLATYGLAIETLFRLQNSFMDESKRTLIANKKDLFAEAANVAIQLGDCPNAFQLVEKGKASTLLAAVNNKQAIKFSDIPDSLVELENEYKRLQFVYTANENTDSVLFYQAKHDSLTRYFENHYPKYYKFKYSSAFTEPCKQLNTNQVLLEYALTDTLCITLVVTREGYRHYSFPVDSAFYSKANTFINLLKNYDLNGNYIKQYTKYVETAYSLWEILIKPLDIPGGKSLIIVPDGILSYIPFEAFLYKKPAAGKTSYHSLSYLLLQHPVSYSYSVGWLVNSYIENKAIKVGAFAIDYRDRNDLMTLSGSVPEAEKLTKLFNGNAFINGDCTREAFFNNAANYNILHFSMHGDIDPGNSMDSKLVFYDNDVYAWEVYGMKLNARLAFLSACSTGDGTLDKGEGVFSMGRAFAYAGCPTIVMSLWTEKDNLPYITTNFYKYCRKGASLDKAMQRAKIDYVKQKLDTHPHYWANKVMMGSTQPLRKQYTYWVFILVLLLAIPVYIMIKRKN